MASLSSAFFEAIGENSTPFYIIHYSCESLHDGNNGYSPRIASIVALHYPSKQSKSFSIHISAEEMEITKSDIIDKIDEVEKHMLCAFNDFMKDHASKKFIHWNMRSIVYGFEHIEHRMKIRGIKKPYCAPVENRFNLSDILIDKYGEEYTDKKSRMQSLMDMNGGAPRDFIPGLEEVGLFKNGDFLRLHNSTFAKVLFLDKALTLATASKLKTKSRKIWIFADRLLESRTSKIIALASAALGILGSLAASIYPMLH
jgi:hypothetical protein